MLGIISLSVCQEEHILAIPRFRSTIEIHFSISKDSLKTITLYVTAKYLLKLINTIVHIKGIPCGFRFKFISRSFASCMRNSIIQIFKNSMTLFLYYLRQFKLVT